MRNHFRGIPRKIYNFRRNLTRIYKSKFATVMSKLLELVANCSGQTANQNANIEAEVCKVARKRTSGLTVKMIPKGEVNRPFPHSNE